MKTIYENKKDKSIGMAKENSETTYGHRLCRELNNNMKSIETVQEKTIEKWKIKYNTVKNEYYVDD